jgi:hypothetical protein
MGLTNPYRQKHYQGEYATETGTGSVLAWIRANKWDSAGDGTGDPQEGMCFYDTAVDRVKVFTNAVWKGLAYTTDAAGAGGSDHQIQFNDGGTVNGAATLYWDHGTSRVGLGTSTPTVDFDVVTESAGARGIKQRNYSATADAPAVLALHRTRGTAASPADINTGDTLGLISISGRSAGADYVGAQIGVVADGTTAKKTHVTISTLDGTTFAERVRITGDGKVGIANAAPAALLTLGTAGTTAGSLSLAGGTSGTCTVQVAAVAGTTTFQYPATNGTDGYYLKTNGSGVTSWAAVAAAAAGSTGWVQFNTGGAFNADANLFWDNTNKWLGIGHSAPATQLDVRRDGQVHILGLTASITDPTLMGLYRSRGSLATPTAIQTNDVIGLVYFSGYGASTWVNAVSIRAIAREAFTNSTARSDLAVYTCFSGSATSAEVARFTSNGLNIGNGPASVEWPLTVSRESVITEIANIVHSATAAHGAYYYAGHTRGTRLAPTATQSGDFLGQYTFIGFGTSQWVLPVALQAYADEAYTNSAAGSHLRILTTPTGSAASVERVRVTSAGYVQINTTVDPIIEGAVQNRRLVVSGAAGYNSIANESSAGAAYYEFLRCNGTVASKTVVASGDTLGGFYAYGWNTNTSACYRVSSGVGFEVDAALSGIYVPGRIVFSTMSGAGAFVERMRLTSDNKLRMGAYTPMFDFQLTRVGSAYQAVFGVSNTASDQGTLLVGRARGTSDASPSVVSSGDALGALYFCGYEAGFRGTAWIGAFAAQTWASGANGGHLTFNTTPSDTATSVERVRITDVGVVQIGKAGGATGRIDLLGTTSGAVTLKVADAAGSWTMTLPAAAPGVTGYVLSATTAGVCSWIAAGGGTTVDAGTAAGQLLFWDNGNTKWTYAETSEWVWDDTNKRVGINVAAPSSRLDVGGDIEVASDAWTYYGDPTTNGSWRTGRTGDDLVVEKRIAGTWTTKHTFA